MRTFYIDYSAGSDDNNGTSKLTPWKHAPVMQPFSGTYVHANGDRFIFKGGVTWPNAALPLLITKGGGAATPDYYGIDATWYSGGSWTRPIFDAQSTAFTNWSGNRDNPIWIKGATSAGIEVEGIEIKKFLWRNIVGTSESDGCGVYLDTTSAITLRNVYVHDWVVRTTAESKFGGLVDFNSSNTTAIDCIIQAPSAIDAAYRTDPNGQCSGVGIMGFTLVERCEVIGTTQGIWACGTTRFSYIHDGGDSYSSVAHENGAWIQNNAEFYGNRVENWTEGVGLYILPGWGSRANCTTRVFNNVLINIPQINLSPQSNPDLTNSIYFFNNTVVDSPVQLGTTKAGAPFSTLLVENNLLIGSAKITLIDVSDFGANYTNAHNVQMTTLFAADAGMTLASVYKPGGAVPTIAGGHALIALTTIDFEQTIRPTDFWTVGAYEAPGNVAPVFTVDPDSASRLVGESLALTALATGTPSPTYQWYKNGVARVGAIESTYTIDPIGLSDAADYYCVATNAAGTDQSDTATITVSEPEEEPEDIAPSFSIQPLSQNKAVGASLELSVLAEGVPTPTYQWYKNAVLISGATSQVFTIPSLLIGDSGDYYCVATNSAGSAQSDSATVTVSIVEVAPVFVIQPTSQEKTAGQALSLTVLADGVPDPTYQWFKDGVEIGGETNATYTIDPIAVSDAGDFYCVATNAADSVQSNTATISVIVPPSFSLQPVSQSKAVGDSLTLTVLATGLPTPTYQWFKNGVRISGATSQIFTIPSLVIGNAGTYYCVATNTAGSAQSDSAVIAVSLADVAPSFSVQPLSQYTIAGQNLILNVLASGVPAPTYQWFKNGVEIPGATLSSLTLVAVDSADAGTYYCVASNSSGSVQSNAAVITIQSPSSSSSGNGKKKHDAKFEQSSGPKAAFGH